MNGLYNGLICITMQNLKMFLKLHLKNHLKDCKIT